MTAERKGVLLRLSPELLERVDIASGALNRTAWLTLAIEGYLQMVEAAKEVVPVSLEEYGDPQSLVPDGAGLFESTETSPADAGDTPSDEGAPFPVAAAQDEAEGDSNASSPSSPQREGPAGDSGQPPPDPAPYADTVAPGELIEGSDTAEDSGGFDSATSSPSSEPDWDELLDGGI